MLELSCKELESAEFSAADLLVQVSYLFFKLMLHLFKLFGFILDHIMQLLFMLFFQITYLSHALLQCTIQM